MRGGWAPARHGPPTLPPPLFPPYPRSSGPFFVPRFCLCESARAPVAPVPSFCARPRILAKKIACVLCVCVCCVCVSSDVAEAVGGAMLCWPLFAPYITISGRIVIIIISSSSSVWAQVPSALFCVHAPPLLAPCAPDTHTHTRAHTHHNTSPPHTRTVFCTCRTTLLSCAFVACVFSLSFYVRVCISARAQRRARAAHLLCSSFFSQPLTAHPSVRVSPPFSHLH